MAEPFWTRHRGPYKLMLVWPMKTKVGYHSSTILNGRIPTGQEAEEEALAILNDPRDTVVSVSVYSVREQQYVMHYSKGKSCLDASAASRRPGTTRSKRTGNVTRTPASGQNAG